MQDVPPDYDNHTVSQPPSPPPLKQSRRDKLLGPSSGSPSNLLNPPPACFQRAPSLNLAYAPFEPIDVLALGKNLTKGFEPSLPPNPSASQPHPFATHDVALEDWETFTKNVQEAGALSTVEKVSSHVVGPAVGIAFFPAFLIARAIKKRKIAKKEEPVRELVYHWNLRYFHPRSVHVSLVGPDDLGHGRKDKVQDKHAARKAKRRGEMHYGHADHGYVGSPETGTAGTLSPGSDGGTGGKWCLRIRYQPRA
ncbi:hypothetical protein LXA43DRAFT_1021164 [Ganoderma leucocontextum]|nr:hypothetical protein LXA43DRAFT_1021164 [Ganoderma leucocontextum]